jgi:hypothetical protein
MNKSKLRLKAKKGEVMFLDKLLKEVEQLQKRLKTEPKASSAK